MFRFNHMAYLDSSATIDDLLLLDAGLVRVRFKEQYKRVQTSTPPKFNIAPEKWWLEDEFPFGIAYF